MEPDELAHLSSEEKKTYFMNATITHPQLEVVHDKIRRAIRQPAGFSFVLVHGPTGAGKTTMMESLVEQTKELFLSARTPSAFSSVSPYGRIPTPISVLRIEADPPDKSAFNRGYFYRTVLTLLGEQTYSQQMHVDIHAEAAPSKRRRMPRAAIESNDDPDLREGAQAAMYRHGVRVIFLDEAHHLLMARDGTQGSTLQEQLEWLKSLSKTGILFVLVGTYDLFNFGKLNGQIGRRCLPVHFPRYQLEREEDCVAFQTALLELLRRVPLTCEAERWVTDHWLYFYECSVGCIGILKDWLLRAVSAALDDGQSRLSLDCVQDHALHVDIYRQMALDAYEGEQRLNHTASNREHVWRLLQGGELIAPVPPLPPRETPDAQPETGTVNMTQPREKTEDGPSAPEPHDEATPPPPIKKTRTRKKAIAAPLEQEPGSVVQAEEGVTPPVTPPKRGRKKKNLDEAGTPIETEVKTSSEAIDLTRRLRLMLPQARRPRNPNEPGALGNPNRSAIQSGSKEQNRSVEEQTDMKPCSNPTCAYQVEDDARFCGICGAYVGPEMASQTTLIDASLRRIQQCHDLINSLQSERDEKEKAQKIHTVMNIVTSINTNQLPSKPIALVVEEIQVLSTVVQEMIALPSISPTASAADIQHWLISPLEMQQWTELLIALIGSNKFSSFDEATKSAARVALGRFISFVGVNARSNSDAEHVLFDIYKNITVLSVPELHNCFLGVNKGMLLCRGEQRIQHSLLSASPRITPVEVQIFGDVGSEELTLSKVGLALEEKTRETINALEKIQRLGETDALLNEAVVKAYATVLQRSRDNLYLQGPKAAIRLDATVDLVQASLTLATIHYIHVPEAVVSLLTDSVAEMIVTPNYPRAICIVAVNRYIDVLHAIIVSEKNRKEELNSLARRFSSRVASALSRRDSSLNGRFNDVYSSELRK